MKFLQIAIISTIAFFSLTSYAQTSIQPFDATIVFKKEIQPCIQVNLDPEPKTLKKAWQSYLKTNYDINLKGVGMLSNKDLLSAEGVNIAQVSSKTMDFYTQIIEDKNGSEMKVFVRLGYDIAITEEKYPSEHIAVHEILESFIKFYLPTYYQEKINDTEKRVEKLTKEKEGLVKDIGAKTDEIAKLKMEITEKEDALSANKIALTETEEKLITRKEKLDRIRIQLRNL